MTSLEWFNAVASVASILGFFVSIGALFYAKSAAKRAQEARDAVQRVYIQDAWREATVFAEQLEAAVRRQEWPLARSRADDLRLHLIDMSSRYELQLSETAASKFATGRVQLREFDEAVRQATPSLAADVQNRTYGVVRSIQEDMTEELARALAVGAVEASPQKREKLKRLT